jgi:hypothetical protein
MLALSSYVVIASPSVPLSCAVVQAVVSGFIDLVGTVPFGQPVALVLKSLFSLYTVCCLSGHHSLDNCPIVHCNYTCLFVKGTKQPNLVHAHMHMTNCGPRCARLVVNIESD